MAVGHWAGDEQKYDVFHDTLVHVYGSPLDIDELAYDVHRDTLEHNF